MNKASSSLNLFDDDFYPMDKLRNVRMRQNRVHRPGRYQQMCRRAPSRIVMTARLYHFAAIVGGGIAGSVAAEILADNGIHVVVIEQNKRPYGKIEDGLPRWHLEQRKQEYSRIDARLKKPGVLFLPCTRLGRDLDFQDLFDN